MNITLLGNAGVHSQNTAPSSVPPGAVCHLHYGQDLQRPLKHYVVFCFIAKIPFFLSFLKKNANPFHAV